MSTIISEIFENAQQYSENTCINFDDISISYKDLAFSIERLAGALANLGIKKGDRVAIMLPNVPHFCFCYYAILSIGAVAVPLNFMQDPQELHHQLKDSGAKLLITWQGFKSIVLETTPKTSDLHDVVFLGNKIPSTSHSLTKIMSQASSLPFDSTIQSSDLAVINYTSGIADSALGAELTFAAIESNASTCVDMFHISPLEKVIAVLPLFHPLGQTLVMNATLFGGSSMVLMPRFHPEEVINAIKKYNVTFMPAVPGMFKVLNEHKLEDNNLPSLKFCMSYGGHLPDDVLENFEKKYNTRILKAYGLTEAGPLVASTRIDRDAINDSTGIPLVGVEIQIRDKSNAQLRPNNCGEIFIKSPGLMQGYHNQPEESQKRLINGWLATGDIGHLDIDHYLYVQERKEDIIVKGGFEIFPREVERILLEHPFVDEAAVIGVPDALQGAEVKAFIVKKENVQLEDKELFEFCKNSLPLYKCPQKIEFVPHLPKSPTGRVLKRFLNQKPKGQTLEENNKADKI